MSKQKVLFVCIHNSARSQMAEAFLNKYGAENFVAQSAGLEPVKLNPLVVAVMKEVGIDISAHSTKGVQEFLDRKEQFDYVITVCDETAAERCPVFSGKVKRLHWGFADPSSFKGMEAEKLSKTREVREQIKKKIVTWLKEIEMEQKTNQPKAVKKNFFQNWIESMDKKMKEKAAKSGGCCGSKPKDGNSCCCG